MEVLRTTPPTSSEKAALVYLLLLLLPASLTHPPAEGSCHPRNSRDPSLPSLGRRKVLLAPTLPACAACLSCPTSTCSPSSHVTQPSTARGTNNKPQSTQPTSTRTAPRGTHFDHQLSPVLLAPPLPPSINIRFPSTLQQSLDPPSPCTLIPTAARRREGRGGGIHVETSLTIPDDRPDRCSVP
jgi:hypothetical protein